MRDSFIDKLYWQEKSCIYNLMCVCVCPPVSTPCLHKVTPHTTERPQTSHSSTPTLSIQNSDHTSWHTKASWHVTQSMYTEWHTRASWHVTFPQSMYTEWHTLQLRLLLPVLTSQGRQARNAYTDTRTHKRIMRWYLRRMECLWSLWYTIIQRNP